MDVFIFFLMLFWKNLSEKESHKTEHISFMSNCYISPYFPHSSQTSEITLGPQTENQCLETAAFNAAFQGNKTFIALDNNITADEFINPKNTQTSLKSDIIPDLLNSKCTEL